MNFTRRGMLKALALVPAVVGCRAERPPVPKAAAWPSPAGVGGASAFTSPLLPGIDFQRWASPPLDEFTLGRLANEERLEFWRLTPDERRIMRDNYYLVEVWNSGPITILGQSPGSAWIAPLAKADVHWRNLILRISREAWGSNLPDAFADWAKQAAANEQRVPFVEMCPSLQAFIRSEPAKAEHWSTDMRQWERAHGDPRNWEFEAYRRVS